MTEARVYWLTGLAGAGKSTCAKALTQRLRNKGEHVVFLDGDEIRQVLNKTTHHDLTSRKELALTYSRLCHMLCKQGTTVVCATISMFHEVHEYNRNNIPNYVEILINANIETLKSRNQKGLYRAGAAPQQNVVGISQGYELPLNPDVILTNNNDVNIDHITEQLMQELGV